MKDQNEYNWTVASDAVVIHQLLCSSDLQSAEESGTPVPARNVSSSERHVRSGAVHLLTVAHQPAATFTLASHPPFDMDSVQFSEANSPVYLTRFAVSPKLREVDNMIGLRCIRKAIEIASAKRHDAIRCEVNPKIIPVLKLLSLCGFQEVQFTRNVEKKQVMYLQKIVA